MEDCLVVGRRLDPVVKDVEFAPVTSHNFEHHRTKLSNVGQNRVPKVITSTKIPVERH